MKHNWKIALGLLLGLTLFVCLGACAWADVTWSGVHNITEDTTIDGVIYVEGDVTLNLEAGTTLTVNGGFVGDNLTITGEGTLEVKAGYHGSCILVSNLSIQGGTVNCLDYFEEYGIYATGDVTISGGTVSFYGSLASNGIYAENGNVTINGGTVSIISEYSGIYAKNGDVTISGGSLSVYAMRKGIYAENGNITFSGGSVTTEVDEDAICAENGNITFSGGSVNCHYSLSTNVRAANNIMINGGTVTIETGYSVIRSSNVTIIDGNLSVGHIRGDTVTIYGGTVNTSSYYTGGIESDGNLTINGGQVTATGGIKSSGNVTINGGQVTAKGNEYSCGILSDSGSVTMSWTSADDFIELSGGGGTVNVLPILEKAFQGSNGTVYTSANAAELPGLTSIRLTPFASAFTVTWLNGDGTVLETDMNVPYGGTPSYDGPTPVKASDAQYSYIFSGWSPEPAPATGDATYTATFTPEPIQVQPTDCTITWVNWDGTVLQSGPVSLGTVPVYTGSTPTRPDDGTYRYTFKGWAPEPMPASGDATYTAVFSITPIEPEQPATYTVSFNPNGGSGYMAPVTVPANTIYTLPACSFTPPAEKQFKAWLFGSTEFASGNSIKVESDAEFVALWKDEEKQDDEDSDTGITGDIVFHGGGVTGGDDTWYDGGYAPQRAWKVILAPMQNGKAALGILSGQSTTTEMYVYPTTSVYVFPDPAPGYALDKIICSSIDGTASYDITEARNFVMPAADVVVHVTFKPAG